jgi:hypothetical protein
MLSSSTSLFTVYVCVCVCVCVCKTTCAAAPRACSQAHQFKKIKYKTLIGDGGEGSQDHNHCANLP